MTRFTVRAHRPSADPVPSPHTLQPPRRAGSREQRIGGLARACRGAAIALLALCLPGVQGVQGQATDASISGEVAGTTGQPLADVSITVINESTGFRSTSLTNSAGRFSFRQLPIGGPYSVTASFIGLQEQQKTGITLNLGSTVRSDFTLVESAIELEGLVVTSFGFDQQAERLGSTSSLLADEIQQLPTADRNFLNLASLTPLVGRGLDLSGQRRMSTNLTIDGMNARDQFKGGSTTSGPFTISMEAIKEFEVVTNNYDVTIGRQGGGGINAATKSGTNDWTGSVFSYHRSDQLRASSDFQGRELGEFSSTQWGFSLGGPILRDRLHFFTAFDRQDEALPLFVSDVRNEADEINFGITRSNLERVVSILQDGYGTSRDQPQFGAFDRQTAANTLYSRLDWQLNPTHRLTFRNSFTNWDDPQYGGGDRTLTLWEARRDFRAVNNSALVSLTSNISPNFTNEAKLQYEYVRNEIIELSDIPRGFVRVQSDLPDGTTRETEVQFGGHRFAPEINYVNRLQLTNTSYFRVGDLDFTVGTDNMFNVVESTISVEQGGLFEFASIEDLENKTPFRYSRLAPIQGTRLTKNQYILDASLFGQVEFDVGDNVRTALGLRWDVATFFNPPALNTIVAEDLGLRTDTAPTDLTNIQPRLQVTWDVGGNQRDVVRFGFGAFSSQPPYIAFSNHLFNSGTETGTLLLQAPDDEIPTPDFEAYRRDRSTIPGVELADELPPAFINMTDENFKFPRTWKANVSYNRLVNDRLRLGGNLLFNYVQSNYHYLDRNLVQGARFQTDPDGRSVYVPAENIDARGNIRYTDALQSPRLDRVLELTPFGKGRGVTAVFDASYRLPGGAGLVGSYTYNRAEDNTSFNCCVANTAASTPHSGDPRDLAYAPSDSDFRHKVVLFGTSPEIWGFRVSATYSGISGRPFSLLVNRDIDGDSRSNDLAFIFDPEDPSTPTAIAEGMRAAIENADPRVADYLRANLGQRAGRNAIHSEFAGQVDMKIARNFPTLRGQQVELSLDIFNVANLLNSEWGGQTSFGNRNLLNVSGFDQTTQQFRYSVNQNVGVVPEGGNVWQVQLGARYAF